MSALEKFGVDIFTERNIFERIAVDKPFRPDNPAFIFIKSGTIKLRQHFSDLEVSANMFMVTDPQTIYEVISVTDDFQSRMVSYKREFISALSLKFNRLITYRYFRQQMNRGVPFPENEMEVVWKSVNFLKYILDSESNHQKNDDIGNDRSDFIRFIFLFVPVSAWSCLSRCCILRGLFLVFHCVDFQFKKLKCSRRFQKVIVLIQNVDLSIRIIKL